MSRFLARSGDRCLPFFRALKNPKNFQWMTKCEEAFKQMKQRPANLPRLASISPGEKLGLYLAASPHAVSSILIKESSGEQLPIYYVSHTLSGPEGRQLLKWAVELDEHDIRYVPRTAVKAQAVADFIAELTQVTDGDLEQPPEAWILHVDGSSSSKGAGAGLVLLAPDGRSFERSLRFGFKLVAEQLSVGYEARDPTMAKYLAQVRDLTAKFPYFMLSNVPREENERADALAKLASKLTCEARLEVEELPARAIEVATTAPGSAPITWVQELLRFKRGPSPTPSYDAWSQTILAEIHEGVCGEHSGGQTLAHKILRQGYYWPTMCRDAKAYVQRCGPYQEHARAPRQPAVPLSPIACAWPFAQWGLDLLGPFPPASGQRKYIIVGVDYFTKWVEAEPLATITEQQMEKFVWRNLVTRFGLPKTIITDNGPQFAGRRFREFCANHGI
uniref:Integrase catalytic domain-containing protein n=1 Tax=Musa acuminata subsp. malaccensis TaxID=214687 RepID=A0A804HN59_MUSAM|nr:PREDICTED: uncharacterized protein LOC103974826 [Musa acuminata subsp. malaccensis]